MIPLNNIPNDPAIRMYCSLALASIVLDTHYNRSLESYYKSRNMFGNDIIIRGANLEDVRAAWTAYMMLGRTSAKKFDPAMIKVSSSSSFNPKDELGWFSFFGSNSLHDKVFLPLLGNTTIKLDDDERSKKLGHQIPADKSELKKKVQQFLCQNLIKAYFIIKDKTISFNKGNDNDIQVLINGLGMVKVAQALATITDNIVNINLAFADLNKISWVSLIKLLEAMPKTAKQLDLSYNDLSQYGSTNLIRVLKSIPKNIYSLNLLGNELCKLNAQGLTQTIASLPPSITDLNLGKNELYLLGVAGLIKVLSSLPAHITSLNLDENDLHKFSGKELAQIFRAIPSTVTCLSLNKFWPSWINSELIKDTRLEEGALALSGLHNKLKTLSLQEMDFVISADNVEKAATIVKNIPKSVTKLYLKKFNSSTTNILLYELFKYLPEHTTCPDAGVLEQAKKGKQEKEIRLEMTLKYEKESRNEKLLSLAKKFDAKLEEIKALIDKGVDLDYQKSSSSFTPLMHALDAQNEKVAEYLLRQGANPFTQNKDGETARALVSSNAPIYPILKGYELLFATKAGDLDKIKLLIKASNSIINFQGVGGYTALLLAIEQDMTKIVEFLLSNNPDLSLTCDNGKGPMELAKSKAMKQMLTTPNKPAKKEEQDKESKNKALLSLVEKFDVKLQEVKAVIDSGADINCQASTNGFTPLMLALDVPNERLAEYLLRQGANPLIKNKGGEIARNLVSSNAAIYPILKGYELIFATLNRDLNTIKLLLKTDNFIINFQGAKGYTALLIAIEQDMTEIVAFLLSNNPDLSLTCDDGKGPIELAKSEATTQMLSAFFEPAEEPDDNPAKDAASNDKNSYAFFSKQEVKTTDNPAGSKLSM